MVRVQHLVLPCQVINEVNVVCSSLRFYSFGHVSSKPYLHGVVIMVRVQASGSRSGISQVEGEFLRMLSLN